MPWIHEADGSKHYDMSVKEHLVASTACSKHADDLVHQMKVMRAAVKYDPDSASAMESVAREYEDMAGVSRNLATLHDEYFKSMVEHAAKHGIDLPTLMRVEDAMSSIPETPPSEHPLLDTFKAIFNDASEDAQLTDSPLILDFLRNHYAEVR